MRQLFSRGPLVAFSVVMSAPLVCFSDTQKGYKQSRYAYPNSR